MSTAPAAAAKKDAPRILVIDDERGLRDFLRYELGERGYNVDAASGGAEALALLEAGSYQLVISDISMPGMDGIALLKEIKRRAPQLEVILSTGYGTVENAVAAMKEGAFDFLMKPVEVDRLAAVVHRALDAGELKALVALYETSLALFRSVDLAEVLPLIANLARRLMDADGAVILLRDGAGLRVASQSPEGAPGAPVSPLLAAACALDGVSGLGFGGAPGRTPELADVAGSVHALLIQPLAAGGRVVGFLAAQRDVRPGDFTTRDQRHAAVFAAQAGQAVRNAELFVELQAAQSRLVQSEKLNAMGRVAAGIAHEINNPLTVVLGHVEMVLDSPQISAAHRADLEVAADQARHCSEVVRDLLEFVRQREPRRESFEVIPLVEASLAMSRFGFARVPQIVRRWPRGAPRVIADSLQLKQVLVNLVRNACQAMEDKPESELTVTVAESEGRVNVSIEDLGGGIAPENMSRLFEPFFTTKKPGKGTGLGLYLCRLLVQRHGGEITVRNREGVAGACFTVALNAAPPEAAPAADQHGGQP